MSEAIWSCGVDSHPDSLIYFDTIYCGVDSHPDSLIYFDTIYCGVDDTIYGEQCSWEVCQVCGEKHHMSTLKDPADKGMACDLD